MSAKQKAKNCEKYSRGKAQARKALKVIMKKWWEQKKKTEKVKWNLWKFLFGKRKEIFNVSGEKVHGNNGMKNKKKLNVKLLPKQIEQFHNNKFAVFP